MLSAHHIGKYFHLLSKQIINSSTNVRSHDACTTCTIITYTIYYILEQKYISYQSESSCLPVQVFTWTGVYLYSSLPVQVFTCTSTDLDRYLPGQVFTWTNIYMDRYLPGHGCFNHTEPFSEKHPVMLPVILITQYLVIKAAVIVVNRQQWTLHIGHNITVVFTLQLTHNQGQHHFYNVQRLMTDKYCNTLNRHVNYVQK